MEVALFFVASSVALFAFAVLIVLGKERIAEGKLGDGIRLLVLGAITFSAFLFLVQIKSEMRMNKRIAALEAQLAKQQPAIENSATEQQK